MTHQYFYKDDNCKADKSTDKECICWLDEGTGTFANERSNDPFTIVEWREKEKR